MRLTLPAVRRLRFLLVSAPPPVSAGVPPLVSSLSPLAPTPMLVPSPAALLGDDPAESADWPKGANGRRTGIANLYKQRY